MSILLMAEIFPLQFAPPSDKWVLLALADAANDEGVTWMAVKSKRAGKMDLMRKASLSERAVQGAIKRLVSQGFLIRHENPGRGVVYIVRSTPAASAGVQLPLGFTPAASAPPPAASAGKPSINHHSKKNGGAEGEPVDKCPISGRVLPAGLLAWQWGQYLEMRRIMAKRVSTGTSVILLSKLEEIGRNGWFVGDVVEKAICNGWTDFHEPSAGRVTGIRRAVAGQPVKPVGATAEDEVRLAEIEALDRENERLEARARFFQSVERRNGASALGDIVSTLPFAVQQ